MSPLRLSGSVAVVTGSTRGIGRAVAAALLDEGAAVVINGRDPEAVARAHEELAAQGQVAAVVGSAADPDVVAQLQATAGELGDVDILINCAGIVEPPGSSILSITPEDWHDLIASHLTSTFATCRAFAPEMAQRGRGAIVNTASHAFTGVFAGTGYPAAKGGVVSLTYALAAELREHGIRVNAVCPGAETRMSTGSDYSDHIEELHRRGILDDLTYAGASAPAPAAYVARLYAFLASDLATDLTGRVFSGSGGYLGGFSPPAEKLIAWRDHGAHPPYTLDEIAAALKGDSS